MNQTQMKRFRERIDEKAMAARKRLKDGPHDKQLAYLNKKKKNPANRMIARMNERHVAFWRDGGAHQAKAYLVPVEERVLDDLGQVAELADQKIQRAQDEAIDAVVFLDEADAVKALADFEKTISFIK